VYCYEWVMNCLVSNLPAFDMSKYVTNFAPLAQVPVTIVRTSLSPLVGAAKSLYRLFSDPSTTKLARLKQLQIIVTENDPAIDNSRTENVFQESESPKGRSARNHLCWLPEELGHNWPTAPLDGSEGSRWWWRYATHSMVDYLAYGTKIPVASHANGKDYCIPSSPSGVNYDALTILPAESLKAYKLRSDPSSGLMKTFMTSQVAQEELRFVNSVACRRDVPLLQKSLDQSSLNLIFRPSHLEALMLDSTPLLVARDATGNVLNIVLVHSVDLNLHTIPKIVGEPWLDNEPCPSLSVSMQYCCHEVQGYNLDPNTPILDQLDAFRSTDDNDSKDSFAFCSDDSDNSNVTTTLATAFMETICSHNFPCSEWRYIL